LRKLSKERIDGWSGIRPLYVNGSRASWADKCIAMLNYVSVSGLDSRMFRLASIFVPEGCPDSEPPSPTTDYPATSGITSQATSQGERSQSRPIQPAHALCFLDPARVSGSPSQIHHIYICCGWPPIGLAMPFPADIRPHFREWLE